MVVVCKGCGVRINANEKYYGKRVVCPSCRQPIDIPTPITEENQDQTTDFVVKSQFPANTASVPTEPLVPVATIIDNKPATNKLDVNPNLVSCLVCSKTVSKNASDCPHCGEQLKASILKKFYFAIKPRLTVILLLAILLPLFVYFIISLLPDAPVSKLALSAYDEDDGIVIYFTAKDLNGNDTRANGELTLNIYEEYGEWENNNLITKTDKIHTEKHQIRDRDFISTTIGQGMFKRDALLWSFGRIAYNNFLTPPQNMSGTIEVKLKTNDGQYLSATTKYIITSNIFKKPRINKSNKSDPLNVNNKLPIITKLRLLNTSNGHKLNVGTKQYQLVFVDQNNKSHVVAEGELLLSDSPIWVEHKVADINTKNITLKILSFYDVCAGLREIEIFNEKGENIASNALITASSVHDDDKVRFGVEKVVDGADLGNKERLNSGTYWMNKIGENDGWLKFDFENTK